MEIYVLDKKIVAFYNCSTAISIDQLQVAMKGKPVEYHRQYFTTGSLPTGNHWYEFELIPVD